MWQNSIQKQWDASDVKRLFAIKSQMSLNMLWKVQVTVLAFLVNCFSAIAQPRVDPNLQTWSTGSKVQVSTSLYFLAENLYFQIVYILYKHKKCSYLWIHWNLSGSDECEEEIQLLQRRELQGRKIFYIFIKTFQHFQDLTSHFKSSRTTSHTKWRFREGFSG